MIVEFAIRFHGRCSPALALQRLSTIVSHQRVPLLGVNLDLAGDDAEPTARIVLGSMAALDLEQLVKRLRREWSIASVSSV